MENLSKNVSQLFLCQIFSIRSQLLIFQFIDVEGIYFTYSEWHFDHQPAL